MRATSNTRRGLQSAVRAIVLDALAKGPGATLIKNSDLRQALSISAGTAQRALDLLGESGALQTVSRGHLGRLIESVDVGQCWQTAGLEPLRVTLSPGGAIEMDALEDRLGLELASLGIPHTMQHTPGGTVRLNAVANGWQDLTVVSSGTHHNHQQAMGKSWAGPQRVLDPGTYYAPDRLVAVRRMDEDPSVQPCRVAIDRDSADHVALTTAEFGAECTTVDVPFPDVPAYVLVGIVDAGIWHITNSAVPIELSGLRLDPLQRDATIGVRDELSRAKLVGWTGRPEIQSVVDALDLTQLRQDQQSRFAQEAARLAPLNIARNRG
ncbi:MAG: YhfZ family protein [Beutenbergiaceae bacterium]